jgi:hypothetical protein
VKSALLFAAGVCFGAVAVLVAEALRSGGIAVLPVADHPVADHSAGADRGRDGIAPPVAPAAARDDALAAAMRELARKVDELAARAPERVAVAPAGSGIDEEALARAVRRELDRRESERFATLKDFELMGEANRLCDSQHLDRSGALRAVEALLARELSPALRVQATTLLGSLQRQSGQYTESVATLQRVVDAEGLASREGGDAAYQLVWTFNEQKNYAAALELAGRVAREPKVSRANQLAGRWAAAVVAANSGDVDGARREFATLAQQLFNDPQCSWIAQDSSRRLQELR